MNATPPTPNPDQALADVDRRVQQVFRAAEPRSSRRRTVVAAVAAVAVLVAGVGVASAGSGSEPVLRTTSAEITDVAAELTSVATIESVSAAAVGFPADGTVATLEVAVGETVSPGQALASLDETELERTVNDRTEELARAELALARALSGEASDDVAPAGVELTNSASGTDAATAQLVAVQNNTVQSNTVQSNTIQNDTVGSTQEQSPTAQMVSSDPAGELEQLQQAVLAAQQQVSATLLQSQAALDASNQVCDPALAGDSTTGASTGSAGGDLSVESEESAEPEDPSGSTDSGAAFDACRDSLAAVQEAQDATADAQNELVAASAALDSYLNDLASGAVSGSDPGSDPGTGNASDATGEPSGGGSDVLGGSTAAPQSPAAADSPTSAELVAYQKTVDAAQLQVLVAEQALARATIVSPIGGTVVSIGFDAGDSVSAASATQNVAIAGDQGIEVVTTVALADVASVAPGQSATVLPDGSDEPLAGEVVAISPVPESNSTNYRVTIGLLQPDTELASGTTGSVVIVTADVRDALAVPSSAVHVDEAGASVAVERDGATEEVRVEIGVTGSDWIEVTEGLTDGDVVVLADLAEPLPGSDDDTTSVDDPAATDLPVPGGGPPAGLDVQRGSRPGG